MALRVLPGKGCTLRTTAFTLPVIQSRICQRYATAVAVPTSSDHVESGQAIDASLGPSFFEIRPADST